MKILYIVIDGKISGGNKVCLSILQAAKKAGCKTELLSPNEGALTDMLRNQGVKVYIQRLTRSFHFHQALKLVKLIKKQTIELVHTPKSKRRDILERMACSIAGVPIICHQHDPTDIFNPNPLISRYQHWLDRATARSVARFIAVAEVRREAMLRYRKYPQEKVTLIYNGICVEEFSSPDSRNGIRNELRLQDKDIAVGLIGRLETAKGQETLIEAAAALNSRYSQVKIFIVGDDHIEGKPCLARYQKMIKDHGLEHKCFLLGFRPDIKSLMQGMDIIVAPSLWEAHSIVILEALAARKPIIASRVGGTPEIMSHNQEGILISPKDPKALAQEICRLIENPELARRIAENGYLKVKKEFSEKKMIDKVFSVYREINGSFK